MNILEIPFINNTEDKTKSNYLSIKIMRYLKSQPFHTLEILPDKLMYIDEDNKLQELDGSSEGKDILGISINNDNYITLYRMTNMGPTPISISSNLYTNIWDKIIGILKKEYNTDKYELYFSFERSQFILIPELDTISYDDKNKLFRGILKSNIGWINFLLNNQENLKTIMTSKTYDKIVKECNTPIWVNVVDIDPFKDQKSELLRKIYSSANNTNIVNKKIKDLTENLLGDIKRENYVKGNYQIIINNKPDNLNMDYIHWVLVKDIIIHMIGAM